MENICFKFLRKRFERLGFWYLVIFLSLAKSDIMLNICIFNIERKVRENIEKKFYNF